MSQLIVFKHIHTGHLLFAIGWSKGSFTPSDYAMLMGKMGMQPILSVTVITGAEYSVWMSIKRYALISFIIFPQFATKILPNNRLVPHSRVGIPSSLIFWTRHCLPWSPHSFTATSHSSTPSSRVLGPTEWPTCGRLSIFQMIIHHLKSVKRTLDYWIELCATVRHQT